MTRAGLPIGLQIIGQPFDEARVLQVARTFERGHDFVSRRPPLA
jgi:aspartyl-tRNA(Asn)/glutamyl-tRNA(Gln) amidotransferase subunit A